MSNEEVAVTTVSVVDPLTRNIQMYQHKYTRSEKQAKKKKLQEASRQKTTKAKGSAATPKKRKLALSPWLANLSNIPKCNSKNRRNRSRTIRSRIDRSKPENRRHGFIAHNHVTRYESQPVDDMNKLKYATFGTYDPNVFPANTVQYYTQGVSTSTYKSGQRGATGGKTGLDALLVAYIEAYVLWKKLCIPMDTRNFGVVNIAGSSSAGKKVDLRSMYERLSAITGIGQVFLEEQSFPCLQWLMLDEGKTKKQMQQEDRPVISIIYPQSGKFCTVGLRDISDIDETRTKIDPTCFALADAHQVLSHVVRPLKKIRQSLGSVEKVKRKLQTNGPKDDVDDAKGKGELKDDDNDDDDDDLPDEYDVLVARLCDEDASDETKAILRRRLIEQEKLELTVERDGSGTQRPRKRRKKTPKTKNVEMAS